MSREFIKRKERKEILKVIEAAREIQEFLWSDMNNGAGLEEFKRMLRKRLAKVDEISIKNPHWKIELKKRLLQIAAISVNLIVKINTTEIKEGVHPTKPSNLPNYDKKINCL